MLGSGRHRDIPHGTKKRILINNNSSARAGAGAVLLWLPRWNLGELVPFRANPLFFDLRLT